MRPGIPAGIPVAYQAGDQPNNALSLNVLEPGEIAATTGTSGVVYDVSDTPVTRKRVNSFIHVNHSTAARRYSVLLCINGTIAYSWLRRMIGGGSCESLNAAATSVELAARPIGAAIWQRRRTCCVIDGRHLPQPGL